MSNMDLWKGKIAVVTGASTGIGAGVAVELARAGINVVGLARRKELIDKIVEENSNLPGKIYSIKCDVRDSTSVKKAFSWVSENLGGVDILINNAGIANTKIRMIDDEGEDELLDIIQTNMVGALLCVKEAYKSMKERDTYGYIINVNSISGHQTSFPLDLKMNVYPATKYAMTAMTETMRLELLALNNQKVRVSSISPGMVKTEIVPNGFFDKLPHLQISDISNAILFMLNTPTYVHIQDMVMKPVGERF